MRVGDRNAGCLEGVPNRHEDFAANIGEPVGRIGDPEPQLEIERRFPETRHPADRLGIGAGDPRDRFDGVDGDPRNLMWIAVIGGSETHLDTDIVAGKRPVHHLLGNEVLVGDEIFLAVAGDDGDEAGAQVADRAEGFPKRDRVARLDRLVEQDDDPGDEVRHHLLQAEADADADGAGKDGERRQIDPGRRQRDHAGKHDEPDLDQLADQHLQRRRQVGGFLNPVRRHVAGENGEPDHCGGEHDRLQYEQQRKANGTEIDGGIVERRQHRAIQPERVKREVEPAKDGDDARQRLVADDAGQDRDDEPGGDEGQHRAHQPAIGRPAVARQHDIGDPQPDDQEQPFEPPHEGDDDAQQVRVSPDHTGAGFERRL
ncbi:hypothetical protein SAMCFNEI73_pC0012 (plasmid) [Sinorhizobium americanum]|uniref:Uncharacterized protein n=1 Tax=Sinorhizobium americanum TaxID=194963 RepID=A0A1L3LUH4_9HYPH|nr:hypothetical protein SAMCFNEI73_pC0012 [Sinorhizobium americanum]